MSTILDITICLFLIPSVIFMSVEIFSVLWHVRHRELLMRYYLDGKRQAYQECLEQLHKIKKEHGKPGKESRK